MMLKGKVALITGASRGIGRAIAIELAKEGCNIVVNYNKSKTNAEEIVKEVEKLGQTAIAIRADVSKFKEVKDMVQEALGKFGKIDILVNNAGIAERATLAEMTEEMWDRTIAVDLKGIFNCSKAVVDQMIKNKSGKIVNISSVAAIVASRAGVHYASAKAGILGFTRTLVKELAPYHINVNAILPTYIRTDMVSDPESRAKEIPWGRIGEPSDIAKAVLFLVSDDSDFITGQNLVIDGGGSL